MKFRYCTKEQRNTLPAHPGIYAFKRGGELLYLGKAANLKNRVKSHFQAFSSRDHLFIDKVKTIGIIETASEIEALLLESQLIKKLQPRYNVIWKDDKRYFYVAVTKEKFPRIFITHQPEKFKEGAIAGAKFGIGRGYGGRSEGNRSRKADQTKYIGPFVDGKPLKQTLRILRAIFPYYTGKHPRVLCSYCHLELCPGPNPDIPSYQKNVKRLIAVLEGKKLSLLKTLAREMKLLSQQERYEEAATVRNKIQSLQTIFANAKVLQWYSPLKGTTGWSEAEEYLRRAVGSAKRISRMEAYDISNIQGKNATGSMVVFVEGKPAKQFYRKFKIRIAGKSDDYAMMKELVSRRVSHKEWGLPELMLIDGGKGQLSSALAGLKTQNVPSVKLVALAKKHNELFLEGKKEPFLLNNMPLSLSHVLLRIRDEAHRFAISYHRKLRRIDTVPKKE